MVSEARRALSAINPEAAFIKLPPLPPGASLPFTILNPDRPTSRFNRWLGSRSKWAIPSPITVQNMRFMQKKTFFWAVPLILKLCFQEFRLKWWLKELFLHCCGVGWMSWGLEPQAFQKFSICWRVGPFKHFLLKSVLARIFSFHLSRS